MVWEVVQNVGGGADKYTADIKFLGNQKLSTESKYQLLQPIILHE